MLRSLLLPHRGGAAQQTCFHYFRRRLLSSSTKPSSSSKKEELLLPNYFPHYELRQTRFNDNDVFGHINNATYYNYMDDAVNMQLMDRGIGLRYPRFLAENGIQFYRPIAFPSTVRVGLRVVQLGSSSVTYDVGFFDNGTKMNNEHDDDDDAVVRTGEERSSMNHRHDDATTTTLAARGKYVHVYIDEATGRPKPIPDEARRVLELLIAKDS